MRISDWSSDVCSSDLGRGPMAQGRIFVGSGGWTYEPWRGVVYPEGLTQKRELEFASRALTSIEINGTYYSTLKPASWQKWHDETPAGFVFSVKASRYCTNRRELAAAGESIERFAGQGLAELGSSEEHTSELHSLMRPPFAG